MASTLEKKKEHRFAFLDAFYDKVQGVEGHRLAPMEYFEMAGSLDIPRQEAGEIVKYWIGEGVLVRKPASEALALTHHGLVFVEKSRDREEETKIISASPDQAAKGAHTAFVLNVLIASPSDVNEERDTVTSVIHEWNDVQFATSGILLRPVRWETHSFPASGDRPQAILNKQIVDDADFVIGIFGYRLGTPSGEAQSGTIEEIERLRSRGKHVSLYFSTAPVPRDADRDQLDALESYQRERQKDTLYATFASTEDLRNLVSRHLPSIVSEVFNDLKASHAFDNLEKEVRTSEARSERVLSELAVQPPAYPINTPLKINLQLTGEFPDGPNLRITTSRPVIVTQIDYLDERNVRISSDNPDDKGGQDFQIKLDHAKLIKIHNLKPRGPKTIPLGFRVHLLDGQETLIREFPALMEPSFKSINGTQTNFMKLMG